MQLERSSSRQRKQISIEFAETAAESDDHGLCVLAYQGEQIGDYSGLINASSVRPMRRAMLAARFEGAAGQQIGFAAPAGRNLLHLLVLGGGRRDELDERAIERAGAEAYNALSTVGATAVTLSLDPRPSYAARAALGALLASYRFDFYQTPTGDRALDCIARVRVVTTDPDGARKIWDELSAVAEGVFFARDLVSEPANVLTPEEFVRRLNPLALLGVDIEVLDEAAMSHLQMNALLAVGAGSREPSFVALLRWSGAAESDVRPLCFIGKGVCFDSGGLNIKSAATAIEYMKFDMGGAAAVAGLILALARRKAGVNVVGIIGLVENMPDGAATRPGDVVRSMSGKTIEIINTDAEGRLVLADLLSYCEQRFDSRLVVDVATLTGSMDISLGHDLAGLFANDQQLAALLLNAGLQEGEEAWQMPLQPTYRAQLESPIADLRNTGETNGRSITAALFLEAFVGDTPWAHLDINAVVWRKSADKPAYPAGASGFGVRILNRYIADNHEGQLPGMTQ